MNYAITNEIKISVSTVFAGTQERNNQTHYLFSYYISISNLSEQNVKLLSRHWEIYDSLSPTEIVEGPGVIGLQPVLKKGEKYAYKSHCILSSNCGSMKGYYTMMNLSTRKLIRVTIPRFQLQTETFLN